MKKSLLAFILSGAVLFTCIGCSDNTEGSGTGENPGGTVTAVHDFGTGSQEITSVSSSSAVPDYSGVTESMKIIGWNTLDPNETQLGYFRDAGFTDSLMLTYEGYLFSDDPAQMQKIRDCMQYYSDNGVNFYYCINNGWQTRGNGMQLGSGTDPSYFYRSVQMFRDYNYDPTVYDTFKGIFVFDEPGGEYGVTRSSIYNDFDFLMGNVDSDGDGLTDTWRFRYDTNNSSVDEMLVGWFGEEGYEIREEEGVRYVYGPSQWEMFKGLWEDGTFKNGSYGNYEFFINMATSFPHTYDLDQFAERVLPHVVADGGKITISVDAYPLQYDAQLDEPTITKPALLQSYALSGDLSNRYGVKFDAFVSTGQLNVTEGFARGDDADGYWSEAEMRWQIYAAMGFGSDSIEYFVYYTSNTESGSGQYIGVVDGTGRYPTKAMEYSKNANAEAQAMYKAVSQFTWQGSATSVGTRNRNGYNPLFDNLAAQYRVKKHSRISSFTSTRDTLINCMKNDLYDGFLLFNIEDPYYKRTDTVTIGFNNASKVLVYGRTKQSLTGMGDLEYGSVTARVVDLTDGKLTIDIDCGDALFLIPIV